MSFQIENLPVLGQNPVVEIVNFAKMFTRKSNLIVWNIPTQIEVLCSLNLNNSYSIRLYSYYKNKQTHTHHVGSLDLIIDQNHEATLCNKGQSKFILDNIGGVC